MSKTTIRTACVRMIGTDLKINVLPIKCRHCNFPDLDHIPSTYLLPKVISGQVDIAPALHGNFLVRDRVRRILQLVAPRSCTFHRAADARSKKAGDWWLAVPTHTLKALYPPATRPFCSQCRASKWGVDLSDGWQKMRRFDSGGIDVFKSSAYQTLLAWGDPTPPNRTCYLRDLYFSARLVALLHRLGLNRLKVGGRLEREPECFYDGKPSRADEIWIEAKLKVLAEHGLVETPQRVGGKPSPVTRKWFKQFLKRNTTKQIKPVDFAAVEAKHKLLLPSDYKDFISAVGPKSFKNVCHIEETVTSILLPRRMDFRNFRCGKVPHLEDTKVDGVMMAETDFGDCFVFDVSVGGSDYPVYWYQHEENTLEPFAPNFAECIKRFAQRN